MEEMFKQNEEKPAMIESGHQPSENGQVKSLSKPMKALIILGVIDLLLILIIGFLFTVMKNTVTLMPNGTDVYTANDEASPMKIKHGILSEVNLTEHFTREGYYMTGWSTKSDGAVEYTPKATIRSTRLNTKLYAIWEREHTVTLMPNEEDVQFNAGYGDDDAKEALPIKLTYRLDSDIYLKAPFDRNGYYMGGWSSEPDGTAEYSPEDLFHSPDPEATLYAVWLPLTGRIDLNCNGGRGEDISILLKTGETIKLPPNTFTNSNAVFAGWTRTPMNKPREEDFVGTREVEWKDEDMFTYDSTVQVLYAVWEIPEGSVYIEESNDGSDE